MSAGSSCRTMLAGNNWLGTWLSRVPASSVISGSVWSSNVNRFVSSDRAGLIKARCIDAESANTGLLVKTGGCISVFFLI